MKKSCKLFFIKKINLFLSKSNTIYVVCMRWSTQNCHHVNSKIFDQSRKCKRTFQKKSKVDMGHHRYFKKLFSVCLKHITLSTARVVAI